MSKRGLNAGNSALTGFGLQAFTDDELDTIHFATLQVLRNTGIKVESEEALDIYQNGGATVERRDGYGLVKIPNHVVEDCIRATPRSGIFYGRKPEHDYIADGKRTGFSPSFGENVQIIDPDTRKVRATVKEDGEKIARIADYYDELVVVARSVCSGDQYPPAQALHNYEAIVNNTSKHCFIGANSGSGAKKIIEMAKVAAGGEDKFNDRPIVTIFVCPTSPLTLVRDCCESIMESAKGGVGIAIIPMSLSGASSPATLGGVVVQHNAEVLSAIILAQLTRKGTPCTYCGCSTIMDLRCGSSPIGVPEMGMLSVAWAKICQYYQIPSWVGGCASDSKLPDAQAAYDLSINGIPSALAGANLIYGLGSLESGITFDLAAMVMGAEQIYRIHKMMQGIEISEESMALDLIHEIGPEGEFLTHEHTLKHMRSMSQGKLFDRQSREGWMASTEGKDLTERAYEEAQRIINEHKPLPLPDGAAEKMKEIIAEYETTLKAEKKK